MRSALATFGVVACLMACQSGNKSSSTAADPVGATQSGNTSAGMEGNTTATGVTSAANVISPDMAFTGNAPVPVCVTTGSIDVNVTVTTSTGPNGFAAPVVISNDLYSMGIDDRTRGDYVPTVNSKFAAFLKALNPGHLRFPAGHNGQTYSWATTGNDLQTMTPALVDQFMALVDATNSNAYFAVNIESAPITDATAFITYANKTKNYGVKWWQIGNEPTLPGLFAEYTTGDVLNPNFQVYISKYLAWRAALQAVDPTIKTVGIEAYTGVDVGPDANEHGEADWLTPFAAGVGGQVDAIAFHYYPMYSGDSNTSGTDTSSSTYPTVAHLLQESASDWPPAGLTFPDVVMPWIRSATKSTAPNVQVWVDEFAEDSGNNLAARGFGDTFVGALWCADSMARYADQGVGAIFHFIFKAYQPDSGIDFGYTLLDPNNDPRPEYYAVWLMAQHYGDRVVATTTSAITQVSSHAALRAADNTLRVLLINKATTAQNVRLQLADYKPTRAAQWNVVGSTIQGTDVNVNGTTLTESIVAAGQTAVPSATAQACTSNIVTLPALSVNVIAFTDK